MRPTLTSSPFTGTSAEHVMRPESFLITSIFQNAFDRRTHFSVKTLAHLIGTTVP